MPSPFQSAGAAIEQTKSAALHVNRMFTGLWTQRNPLRDAATPYLYEKFYSATRYDALLDGVNMEISVRLTMIRRPGSTVYNPNHFPPARRYYAFRTFVNNAEQIRLVGDFQQDPADPSDHYGTIREWTAPVNTILAYKTSPVTSSFLSIGNTLYWTDGDNPMEWALSSKTWQAQQSYNTGDWIVDPNNNIQQMARGIVNAPISAISLVVQSGSGGVTKHILLVTMVVTSPTFVPFPGATDTALTLSVLTTHPEFNGTWNLLNDPTYPAVANLAPNQVAVDVGTTGSAFPTVSETGRVSGYASGGPFQAASIPPTWSTTLGGTVADFLVLWQNKGSAVHKWGIAKPTVAPTVAQTTVPSQYPNWTANTVYSPSQLIVDSNSNLQLLTTSGTTGTSEPTWATGAGATTNDGSCVWTCQGPAGWVASHAYAFGTYVEATFTTVYTQYITTYVNGRPVQELQQFTVTYDYFFQCVTAGNSGATTPPWTSGIGITVQDGTVTWKAIGTTSHWTNKGPGKALNTASQVVDSNGNLETVAMPGISGATAPTWQTAAGALTVEASGLRWTNGGPYSAAATGAWIYAYAWKNSTTGQVSTASPLSTPIVLGPDNQVVLQGPGSTDAQVDTIVLYRTMQGGSLLFWMVEIPAPTPLGSQWTYHSTQTDADLNKLIVAQINSSNDPPPKGLTALQYHSGRVWGFVVNTLVYSNGPLTTSGNGNDSWPPGNNFPYPAQGTYLWPTSIGLVVFTVSDLALVTGDGTSTPPFATIPFQAGIGLLSQDAFGVNGSTAYVMTGNRRLLTLDPGAGELEVGFPVGDLFFALYDPANCNVTWHEGKSADTALYVADNTAGWFRMSAISAPETGDLWSPRTLIVGGTSAVRSLEITPGQRRLIIGPPAGGGPILQRDDTVSSDNGTAYPSYGDIGCIVLAQPGQIAAVEFLTLDSKKIGSPPTVAVLMGELSGTFEYLQRNRQDPPLLPPAQTLYSDRFYMFQSQEPVWCRFLQIRMDFGTEAFPNELLTYTIFGSIENEV